MAAFSILEATIDDLHGAYRSGSVTCREVIQAYRSIGSKNSTSTGP
jgi:hypothetical protein